MKKKNKFLIINKILKNYKNKFNNIKIKKVLLMINWLK